MEHFHFYIDIFWRGDQLNGRNDGNTGSMTDKGVWAIDLNIATVLLTPYWMYILDRSFIIESITFHF